MINGALAMEGGSMRCLFTAGVLDVLLENDIELSYVIGVSAGALSGANYISKQKYRTRDVNIRFVNDKQYLGISTLVKNRMIINFDYLFGEISHNLLPFNYEEFHASKQNYTCIATNCETGLPEYFAKNNCSDIFTAMKASCSIPMMSRMVDIDGTKYLDGGFTIAIPFEKPIEEGYEKIVVVTTRNKGFRKLPVSRLVARAYMTAYRRHSKLVSSLLNTPRMYSSQMRKLDKLESAGRVFVIRPQKPIHISRVEKDTQKLNSLYEDGRAVALKCLDELKKYLEI